jgi:hypothetical protein
MSTDLTAILLPLAPKGLSPDEIINVVAQNSPPAVWVRLVPLTSQGMHQLEVLEGPSGLPSVAPQLVAALSQQDRKALFLHVNQEAKQALMHAFEDGAEVASFVGEPGEAFEKELARLVGWSVDELVAADDGSRVGFGQAASRTAAIVRGRLLVVPPGTPTAMDSFAFHDRGHDRPEQRLVVSAEDDEDAEEHIRVAFFAYDHDLITHAWGELSGAQLAQVIGTAPIESLGPLFPLRDDIAQALAGLDEAPGKRSAHPTSHLRAFEMLAMSHAGAYASGDTAAYVGERLLPLLAIGDAPPVIEKDDAEELEAMDSVLEMMVEVLPCPKPPGGYGPIIESLGASELGALVPWAVSGQEYEGTVFRVQAERLLQLVQSIDGNRFGARLDRFCRTLYEARYGQPAVTPAAGTNAVTPTQEYLAWRRGIEQKSAGDLDRFLGGWAELRIVLEVAAMNRMAVGMIVYGG